MGQIITRLSGLLHTVRLDEPTDVETPHFNLIWFF